MILYMLGSMVSSLVSILFEKFCINVRNDLMCFNIVRLSFSPKSSIKLAYVAIARLILLTALLKSVDGWTILLPVLTIIRLVLVDQWQELTYQRSTKVLDCESQVFDDRSSQM